MLQRQLDQIAFYYDTEEERYEITKAFNIEDAKWVEDIVEGYATVRGVPGYVRAKLQFNYDLGIEFELITILEGQNVYKDKPEGAQRIPGGGYLAHLGVHLDDHEEWPQFPNLIKEMHTEKHTNPHIARIGRYYHYRIHDVFGTYIKFIKRMRREDVR